MESVSRASRRSPSPEAAESTSSNEDAFLSDSISVLLYKTTLCARRLIDARMVEHGLTDAQWRPLRTLAAAPVQTTAALAREMCTDAGALTRMLDRLETKGFVERTRSTADRRVVHVSLTPKGRSVAAKLPEAIAAVDRQLLRDMSEIDQATLRHLCLRIQRNATI